MNWKQKQQKQTILTLSTIYFKIYVNNLLKKIEIKVEQIYEAWSSFAVRDIFNSLCKMSCSSFKWHALDECRIPVLHLPDQ